MFVSLAITLFQLWAAFKNAPTTPILKYLRKEEKLAENVQLL